jgi:ferredoxin--NADP+ reductase
VDWIVAIGPVPMMKAVSDLARRHGVPVRVSLNPIMVDGTGMCGSCRVTVGGETKFACVDGPEFNGYLVDFDELASRNRRFLTQEKEAMQRFEKGERTRA